MKTAKGEIRRLIIVIGELQDKIGMAKGHYDNDRDPDSHEKGQKLLEDAFSLCIKTTGDYEQILEDLSELHVWSRPRRGYLDEDRSS